MNKLIEIGEKELPVIEWKGQRVITTEKLANVYETDVNNIQNNFNRNKERFVEGEHYYVLKGSELKAFKNQVTDSDSVNKHSATIYLWTRKGASRHCKLLGTDKAWEQFDILEDNYYNPKGCKIPNSATEQLKLVMQATLEVDEKIDNLANDIEQFKQEMPLLGVDMDEITHAVKAKGVEVLGGKASLAYQNKSVRQKVYSDIYRQLKYQFDVQSYKALARNQLQKAKEIVGGYTVPVFLQDLIIAVNSQMHITQ